MRNKRLRTFISFNWQWYLVILAFVSFVFYYAFEVIRTPSYDERIAIFIAADYVDVNKLDDVLYAGYEDTKIKEVFIDYSEPSGSDFSIIFNTRGTVNTDILILPKDMIRSENYSAYFAGFTYENDTADVLNYNGLIYGINVTDYLSSYVETDDELYLFFNKKSNKIGSLNTNSKNDYALQILEKLNPEVKL